MNAAQQSRLAYRISTDPGPIETGQSGSLHLGVFQPGDVYCSEITLRVPLGPTATDFSEKEPQTALNTPNWRLETAREAHPELNQSGTLVATIDPKGPEDWLIPYPLALQVLAPVNESAGQFAVEVIETSGPGPKSTEQEQLPPLVFMLEKVYGSFFVRNLIAVEAGSGPLVPVTRVANGADFELRWESNGTWFEIYADGSTEPLSPGPGIAKSYTIKGGIKEPTTYVVLASAISGPDQEHGGYRPIYLYETLTVDVADPDLTARSLIAPKQTQALVGLEPDELTVSGSLEATDAIEAPSGRFDQLIATAVASLDKASVRMQGGLAMLEPGTWLPQTDGVLIAFPSTGTESVKRLTPVICEQRFVVPQEDGTAFAWWPLGEGPNGVDLVQVSGLEGSATAGAPPTVRFQDTPVINKTNATLIVVYEPYPSLSEIQMVYGNEEPQGRGQPKGACSLRGSSYCWCFGGDNTHDPPLPGQTRIEWPKPAIYGNNVAATIDYPADPAARLPVWTFGPVDSVGTIPSCWVPSSDEQAALLENVRRPGA